MTSAMRPTTRFCFGLVFLLVVGFGLGVSGAERRLHQERLLPALRDAVNLLSLTDLCVTTEARYTRHPAVTDLMVPFMDHPGAFEHFPSGSFFAVPDPFVPTSR